MRIPERFYEERHYLLHVALLSLAIGLLLLFLGEHITMIERRSTDAMDGFLKYRKKIKSEEIAIIAIDEAAFQSSEVGATQPISRSYLAKVINVLTDAHPRVIAIDIDLSSNEPDQSILLNALKAAEQQGVRVVISYRLSQRDSEKSFWQMLTGKSKNLEISPEMSSFKTAIEKAGLTTGYVNLNYEGGIVRRMLPVPEMESNQGELPLSLPVVILSACSGNPAEHHARNISVKSDGCFDARAELEFEPGELERINFTNTFPYYSTGFVLQADVDNLKQILEKRILFLGETFEKSQDIHHTPLDGSSIYDHGMQGMELLAHSTNTLIQNRRIRPVPPVIALLIDCAIGFALGLVFVYYGVTRRTAIVSGAAVIALAVLVSFPILALWDHWFDYAATAVGVTFHRIYEKRKATGVTRHLTNSLEGRDLMDVLLKTLDVSNKKGFIFVAELQNFWQLSKNYPETNAIDIARFWRELGTKFKSKFPDAQVFADHRIVAVFPDQEIAVENLTQGTAFVLKNVQEMNRQLSKRIKGFCGLRVGIGIDRRQESLVSAIGNACGLAQRASNYSADLLVTETVREELSKSLEFVECGEMKMNRVSIPIFKMLNAPSEKPEPVQ